MAERVRIRARELRVGDRLPARRATVEQRRAIPRGLRYRPEAGRIEVYLRADDGRAWATTFGPSTTVTVERDPEPYDLTDERYDDPDASYDA